MKLKHNIVLFLSVAISMLPLCAQSVIPSGDAYLRQLQKRDSVLIADQLEYGFHIDNMKNGSVLELQDVSKGLIDSVDVVRGWQLDTLKQHKKEASVDLEGSIVITSFDEGEYQLPDIAVRLTLPNGQTDTLVFAGKKLEVKSMPVDTATFKVHDIKGQIRYPLSFKEVLPYILGGIALLALVALIWYLVAKYLKKKSLAEESKEPPYIVALRKLDKFRGNKYWAPEKQKQFYSGVTDALREYIAARFCVGAMEMTTAEIFDGLKDKDIPQPLIDDTKELFVTSDLVKFAKMTVTDDENMKAVPRAVNFVTATWKMEEEELAKTSADADAQTDAKENAVADVAANAAPQNVAQETPEGISQESARESSLENPDAFAQWVAQGAAKEISAPESQDKEEVK